MRRPTLRLFTGLAAAAALALSGCAMPKPAQEHMVLFFKPAPPQGASGKTEPLPFRIQVKDLELDRLYDNSNILLRTTDYTVQYSKRLDWAVRPNITASELLLASLKSSLRCRALQDRFPDQNPDFAIAGALRCVEQDLRAGRDEPAARVAVQLRIIRFSDDRTVFDRLYEKSSPLSDTGHVSLARGLSENLKILYAEFAADAAGVFAREAEAGHAKDNGETP